MMEQVALLLKLLSERVYTARVQGHRVYDPIDFNLWLIRASKLAQQSSTMQELFSRLDAE